MLYIGDVYLMLQDYTQVQLLVKKKKRNVREVFVF